MPTPPIAGHMILPASGVGECNEGKRGARCDEGDELTLWGGPVCWRRREMWVKVIGVQKVGETQHKIPGLPWPSISKTASSLKRKTTIVEE